MQIEIDRAAKAWNERDDTAARATIPRQVRASDQRGFERTTIASTPVTASGRVDSRNLIGHGNDNTHWRTGTDGST